jgi:hypothetical protein
MTGQRNTKIPVAREGDTSQSPAVDAEHVGVCAQKKKFPPFSFKIEGKKSVSSADATGSFQISLNSRPAVLFFGVSRSFSTVPRTHTEFFSLLFYLKKIDRGIHCRTGR